MNNYCVICGAVIPEGRQVCPACSTIIKGHKTLNYSLIKKYREQRGFSVTELANRCGFTKSYLSRLERGLRTPSVSTLNALANVLNCSPADFWSA